ncbi:MAG: hypothetical protein [phage Lak_Megaphage_RVC_AP4_GC26]|jgi:hypothetical protein|uniref:Uncharacterized protein n=1 Tax=phage Lak_Megaphage_RVC_AP3_GC26 TaxID=3109225 RepID=A0ABZ0YZY4_9CAUD|nr:MAG: hypothetical protein [phage Lak_Megaphage_RVC_AP3_GC26]WQJ52444.1 MAG: hypothetical protein [phage Lak_Megaphage_RVC_AP4_GC26]
MRKIKKGEYMHSYTSGPCNDETRWVFPEDFEGLDDNAYYEIEYDYYSAADPCDFSCTYKVTYIKKVDDSLYHIFNILNHYNDASTSDSFMEWFNKHYTLNCK